jgi:hypothetical protein
MDSMALVDPYSLCPCGSGLKFKWCCHKVESFVERADRHYEGGQVEATLHALDEGLRKFPDNPWLMIRKVMVLLGEEQDEAAQAVVEQAVEKHPKHGLLQALNIRIVLQREGPVAGTVQLQRALEAVPEGSRMPLWEAAHLVGHFLGRAGFVPAALVHLQSARQHTPPDQSLNSTEAALRTTASAPSWQRARYDLSPAPDWLDGPRRDTFTKALGYAAEGLFASAAYEFDQIGDVHEALRNLALCRLWLADHPGAEEALGRYVAQAAPTEDTVDMEALRQTIAEPTEVDLLDRMQLNWPLRDRAALLERLKDDRGVLSEGPQPSDPDDQDSPRVDKFYLLDKPTVEGTEPRDERDFGRVIGEVHVGADSVALIGVDDGSSLDFLSDRFTTLAGPAIPPAHPKTKRVGRVTRLEQIVSERWVLPVGMGRHQVRDVLNNDQRRVTAQRWAKMPMSVLGGRTPEQAARAGHAAVPLRAAWELLEETMRDSGQAEVDPSLRKGLGIPEGPPIDPATVDPDQVHIGRLHLIPADQLDDDRLVKLYRRARTWMMYVALERAANALASRPGLVDARDDLDCVTLFRDLANLASRKGDREAALAFVRQGREGEPSAQQALHAPVWDMLEVRVMARFDRPEDWVPALAVVLERYKGDKKASGSMLNDLLDLGLVRVLPAAEDDEEGGYVLDPRPLQAVLERYGPRITTASGGLGMADRAGGIWTPEKEAASRGGPGIWTPGATTSTSTATSGEPSKVIITGR